MCLRSLDRLAKGGGGIIGRFDRRGAHKVAKRDGLTGTQAKFARRLACGMGRNAHLVIKADLAILNGFEHDIKRHHLGEGRGVKPGIGIACMKHLAAARIHHHCRIGRRHGA